MRRSTVFALVAIVVASACGDDDDAAGAVTSAPPVTNATTTSTSATTTSVPPTIATTTAPAESEADSFRRLTPQPAGATPSPLGYYEYLPHDYDDDDPSPLLVFLHGYGESGDGSEQQLRNLFATAIPQDIRNNDWPNDRPFVVLAPQHSSEGELGADPDCESGQFPGSCYLTRQHDLGHPSPGSLCFTPAEIDAFLAYAIGAYDVDPQRVYLTGLSCGAFGLWEYIAEHGNEVVAAVVPIAGEGRPAWATAGCALGAVPIWAFHGMVDDVVEPAGSIEPLTEPQKCSAPAPVDAQLTTYDDADHDSWTRTYAAAAENDIYSWMLGFSNP